MRELRPGLDPKRPRWAARWCAALFVATIGCAPSSAPERPSLTAPQATSAPATAAAAPSAAASGAANGPSAAPAPSAAATSEAAVPGAVPSAPVAAAAAEPDLTQPGRANGPCPAPGVETKRTLARALAAVEKMTDPEPFRAMSEAVRMRLDELYQHGCFRGLDDDKLRTEVALAAPDPRAFTEGLGVGRVRDLGIWASYGNGVDGWFTLYRWGKGKVRSLIVVTGEQDDLQHQLLVLGAELYQPPGAPAPLLALASTHPWMASCWRAMRLRIFAPSGDPLRPQVLLDRPLDGRWCEGVGVKAQGDSVAFTYDAFGGPWSIPLVQRRYVASYQYVGGAVHEHFGFPPGLEDLSEDWLMRPWTLSQEATVDSAQERLRPLHEQLHRQLLSRPPPSTTGPDAVFTRELFPVSENERRQVLYCAIDESHKPCAEWPTPVELRLVRREGVWRVSDVRARK